MDTRSVPPTSVAVPHISADRVQCGLRHRVLGLGVDARQRSWRAVLLTSGAGSVVTGDDVVPLVAPCLAWVPWRPGRILKVNAGGVGYQFAVDGEALVGAIGNAPESVDLRYLVDRRVVAAIEDDREAMVDLQHAFDLIIRELHRPRHGSWTMLQSQLRAVLVILWRLSGVEAVALRSQGEASRILQRFRQLVEMHFRDRWQVGDYAQAIGISPDRLHDTCRRKLGKTPSQLIQERVTHEARLRLERSALTVEQVANSLGFRDAGHFSRFFKLRTGLPPATYRARAALPVDDSDRLPESNFADWP